jgi:hypothetical protein
VFEKCNFGIVGVIKCKNLTFENCKFDNFSLVDSSDLQFKSCEFSVINLVGAHNNLFKDSVLKDVNNYSSYSNTFSDCYLHEIPREVLRKKVSDSSRILQIIKVVSILIAISLVLVLTIGFIFGFNLALINGAVVSLVLLLVMYYLFRDITSPKTEPNKFLNVKKLEQR